MFLTGGGGGGGAGGLKTSAEGASLYGGLGASSPRKFRNPVVRNGIFSILHDVFL